MDLHDLGGKPIKVWVTDSAVVTNLQEKFGCKPVVPVESVHSKWVLLGSQPTRYQESQIRVPKPTKNSESQKFIHPVRPRKIYWIQRYDYLSNLSKMGKCHKKTAFAAWLSRIYSLLIQSCSILLKNTTCVADDSDSISSVALCWVLWWTHL